MKTMRFCYPGDPPKVAAVMNREEFQKEYPDRKIEVHSSTGVKSVSVPDSCILCDVCGERLGDIIVVAGRSKAYCPICAAKYVPPHCEEQT